MHVADESAVSSDACRRLPHSRCSQAGQTLMSGYSNLPCCMLLCIMQEQSVPPPTLIQCSLFVALQKRHNPGLPHAAVLMTPPVHVYGTGDAGSCGRTYDPVCGKDGQTYGNACIAKLANVIVASQGKCPACSGSTGSTPSNHVHCIIARIRGGRAGMAASRRSMQACMLCSGPAVLYILATHAEADRRW